MLTTALALALTALALLLLALLTALAVALAATTLLGGGTGGDHGLHGVGRGVHLSTLTADFDRSLLAYRTGAMVTEPGGDGLLLEEVETAGDGGIRDRDRFHGDGTRGGLGNRIGNEDVANEDRDVHRLFRLRLGLNRNQYRSRWWCRMQERVQILHDRAGLPPLSPELQRGRTTGLDDQCVCRIGW